MSRLLLAFAATTAIVLTGCTSASYDLMETAAVRKQKFQDLDPQDFGTNHPGRHQIHGIDVSKWNGNVDWQTAKRSGVSFVFIKATEGKDMIDPTFEASWKGAAAAGIPHAPYHFYYFCSTPDEQADWFIQNVPKSASLLPPVIDVEWNPGSPTCKTRPAPEQVRAVMQRFMDRLEAHYGKKPIIYTSVDFHRDNLVGHFQNYPFWVRSVAAHPQKIYDSRRWAFWQYTSTGVVPGVPGKTDINVFFGSEKNWLAWVASVSK